MKYLYWGVAILALTLAVCVLSGLALNRRTDEVISPLTQAIEATEAGRATAAQGFAQQAHAQWQRHLNFFTSYLCHDETDEITIGFARLEQASEDEFAPTCNELLVRLQHISQMDLPLWANILIMLPTK